MASALGRRPVSSSSGNNRQILTPLSSSRIRPSPSPSNFPYRSTAHAHSHSLDTLLTFLSEKEQDKTNTPSLIPIASKNGCFPSQKEESKEQTSSSSAETTPSTTSTSSTNATSTFHLVLGGLKAKVASLQKEVARLQAALNETAKQHKAALQAQSDQHEQFQNQTKSKYEGLLQQQLVLIDGLVKEKKEHVQVQHRASHREGQLEAVYQQRAIDLQLSYDTKLKEMQQSWQVKQTNAVKKAAIKSVQPEIDKIVEKNRIELDSLRSACEAKITLLKEEHDINTRRILMEERTGWRAEYDTQRDARESSHQKAIRELSSIHAKLIEDQRAKLLAELDAERQKANIYNASEPLRIKSALSAIVAQHESTCESMRSAHAHSLTQLQEVHATEMAHIKSSAETERELWERRFTADKEHEMRMRESTLHAKLAAERDQQIEMIVTKLGEESVNLSKAERARMDKAMEQLRTEMKTELESSKVREQQLQQRLEDAHNLLHQTDQRSKKMENALVVAQSSTTVEMVQEQLNECERRLSATKANEAQARERYEDDIAKNAHRHEQERTQLEHTFQERLAIKARELQNSQAVELDLIKTRVADTIARKDKVISCLQRELKDCYINQQELQKTIQEQRTDLLSLG